MVSSLRHDTQFRIPTRLLLCVVKDYPRRDSLIEREREKRRNSSSRKVKENERGREDEGERVKHVLVADGDLDIVGLTGFPFTPIRRRSGPRGRPPRDP
jgi:hypothetical protein